MATITKGLDILVYAEVDGKLEAIGGQKNCSLSMEADTIDTSNKNDFGWASFIGGAKSWTVSCDGQFMADDDGQKALMAAFIAGTNVQVEMKQTVKDAEGKETYPVYFAGEAAITSIEVEAAYDDVCALSLELQGVGPLAMEKVENEDPDGE
jgi:TP901-1 family phage major tail protein